jgi:hypothetical protein
MQMVTPKDERCAEAYMETDYGALTQADFELVVKNYALFRMFGAEHQADGEEDEDDNS